MRRQKKRASGDSPLLCPERVVDYDGVEVKYVRMVSGRIAFVDPTTSCSHLEAARRFIGLEPHGLLRPHEVLSAGRVIVDKATQTVRMGERDSHSLGVRSRPGDEDARAVAHLLFG